MMTFWKFLTPPPPKMTYVILFFLMKASLTPEWGVYIDCQGHNSLSVGAIFKIFVPKPKHTNKGKVSKKVGNFP